MMPFRIQILIVWAVCASIAALIRPYWGLLLLVLITFVRPQDDRPNVSQLHLPMIMTWVVIVGTVTRPAVLVPRLNFVMRKAGLLTAFYILMVLSALINGWTVNSQIQISDTLTVLIVSALTLVWVSTLARLRAFVWTLTVAGLYFVQTTLRNPRSIIRESIGGSDYERLSFRNAINFGNPNFLALLMVIMCFIALALLVQQEGFWKKLGIGAALGGYVFVFLRCQSRGATLGLAAGLLVFCMLQKRKLLSVTLIVASVTIGLVFLAPETYLDRLQTILAYQEDASAMGRVNAWAVGGTMIASNPLFGVGPANSEPLARRMYGATSQHNAYLQVSTELGVTGLLMYLAMLLAGFRSVWIARRLSSWRARDIPYVHNLSGAFACILVAFTVQGLFTGFAFREFLYITLMLCHCMRDVAETSTPVAAEPELDHAVPVAGGGA